MGGDNAWIKQAHIKNKNKPYWTSDFTALNRTDACLSDTFVHISLWTPNCRPLNKSDTRAPLGAKDTVNIFAHH